jgi:hypothetical protein
MASGWVRALTSGIGAEGDDGVQASRHGDSAIRPGGSSTEEGEEVAHGG